MKQHHDETKAWLLLEHELDQWRKQKKTAALWWRDDDAQLPSAALDRLILLSQTAGIPVVIAAIPNKVDPSLKSSFDQGYNINVVQHGWSHENHAQPPEKKCEICDHRNPAVVSEELNRGLEILKDRFGPIFLPVLVPPWNRIGAKMKSHLQNWKFTGLSTFGIEKSIETGSGFKQVNTHIDLIDWEKDRRFIGSLSALDLITSHLQQQRRGQLPSTTTTGLLSHHLVHDEPVWEFLGTFFKVTAQHAAVKWQSGAQLFGRD